MRKLFLSGLLAFSANLFAQNYDVALIPDSLRENACAVKRFEELKVVIKSPGKAIIKHKYAITILNADGVDFSDYTSSYSKLRKINDIGGRLLDAAGKELKTVKKKDIVDRSYDDEMSLITDVRLKQHRFYNAGFPYTIEYEDELEYDGLFYLRDWMPLSGEKFAVQQSRFIVETPADYNLRFKQINHTGKPVITTGNKTVTYQWELKNHPAVVSEYLQPSWDVVAPHVLTAPTKFEFGGYEGDMSTWQGLGKYLATLYVGRDVLPANVKQEIHRLTDNIADKKEKIRILYEYLQKNTRYISIQLGIGGFQPFAAADVAAKKYGDCKALSNYMVSILKEAGIRANSVIINSGDGERGLWEDFPANYFNHAVMCIPDGKDTTWLECTSQTASAGYMGSSTGNRHALLISDEGGHVVSTPSYGRNENLQLRKINGVINEEGDLLVEVKTRFTGQQQEHVHGLLYGATEKEKEQYLNRAINLATYKLEKFNYVETKGMIPEVDEFLKIDAPNYASVTGKRIFVMPNLFNRDGLKLPTDKPRRFDISLNYAYRDVDTIHLAIPDGYQAESLPKDVSLKSKFGLYSISFKIQAGSIDVLRVRESNAGIYPASDYPDLVSFFEDMYKADRSRIVLVKKDATP